jgi:hypothetical protein
LSAAICPCVWPDCARSKHCYASRPVSKGPCSYVPQPHSARQLLRERERESLYGQAWAETGEEMRALAVRSCRKRVKSFLNVCLLLGMTSPVLGKPARQVVSLDCGSATLWLGMPEQSADRALEAAGYRQTVGVGFRNPSMLMFYDRTTKRTCDISFSSNRLSYAARDWTDIDGGFDGVFNAVLGAFQSMTGGEFRHSCEVSPYLQASPDGPHNSVDITCGERSVSITKDYFPPPAMVYEVKEYIGTYPLPH